MQNKKRFILLIFTICLASQIGITFAQTRTELNDYKLVWEDNFDGNSLNTSTNWLLVEDNSGGGNNELQYYVKQNVTVGKEALTGANCLIITAKKENYKDRKATSGKLTTQNKMSFQYGKVESRIKFPKTKNGLWPAFWMLGSDITEVQWPRCGEIDIIEMGEDDGIAAGIQDRYFNGALHYGEGWTPDKHLINSKHTTNDYSLQDDFHLYTMIWDKDSIKMYLDLDKYPNNLPYFNVSIHMPAEPNSVAGYFHKPFFLLFNLAIGGTFSDIYDIENITALKNGDAKMYVDFVRVFQKNEKDEVLNF